MNQELEKALRLKDFIELAELMAHDALDRNESCGAHFREEYQTSENEAERNDKDFKYVAAWPPPGETFLFGKIDSEGIFQLFASSGGQ